MTRFIVKAQRFHGNALVLRLNLLSSRAISLPYSLQGSVHKTLVSETQQKNLRNVTVICNQKKSPKFHLQLIQTYDAKNCSGVTFKI